MMDNGQPEPKRPRIGPGPPTPWSSIEQPNPSRALPHPLPSPYNNNHFARSESLPNPLDRRPPTHSNYQEHTDPHRPNSGHSHVFQHNQHIQHPHPPPIPPFNGHNGHNGSREPMVKPDPSEEPPQHRPPPTTNGSDHHVNSPYPDDRGRPFPPKFDQTPPAQSHYPLYPPPPPPPSTSPMTTPTYDGPVQQMYGPPPHQPPPPREQYPVTPYTQAAKPRKAQRAAQACDSCRNLKAKCDEGRPACGSCKEKGIDCHYRDPPPKPMDKVSTDIMEGLIRLQQNTESIFKSNESIFKSNDNILAVLKGLQEKVERLEKKVGLQPLPIATSLPNSGFPLKIETPEDAPTLASHRSFHSTETGESHIPPETPNDLTPVQTRQNDVSSTPGAEEDEEENGEIVPPGQALIPVNHTTGAARLLLVKAIKTMIEGGGGFPKNAKDEKYPMLQEERRGLLRLFGRGEGHDLARGYERDPLVDHGADNSHEANWDVSSPPVEEWGQLGGMTPPHSAPDYYPPAVGSIMSDGMPDFRRSVVLELVKSYKDHINIMHPLLAPSKLDALVESFLKSIPGDAAKPKQIQDLRAGFIGMKPPESPGTKRKRSPGAEPLEMPYQYGFGFLKPGHPSRSISTALVLVVLALGKICQEKGKIPELPKDVDGDSAWGHMGSPIVRNGGHPSPIHSSPGSSSELPSPQDGVDRFTSRSRRTSMEFSDPLPRGAFRPRNVDVVPGLAYFALATDIIGNQLAGVSLQHVHVSLLAGLYHGQLGRILESYAYIAQACRSLQYILRPKMDRFRRLKRDLEIVPVDDNPLIIAFWSCLQLESDILAELPCPQSGILAYEEDMPSPNLKDGVEIEKFEEHVLMSYSQQLYARKHLNQLHNMFYKPDNDTQFPSVYRTKDPKHFTTIKLLEENIKTLQYECNDDDPLPTDILSARMRAKYYGAQVITYRNFVLKILDHSQASSSLPIDEFRDGIEVPSINKYATKASEINPQALDYARSGIKALINSTTAFHGMGEGRLIVTNVWGTAHAQWGNVLTLQAAWNDPILKGLFVGILDEDGLRRLLYKTLGFLGIIATRSSALYTDMKILVAAGRYTGLLPKDYEKASYFLNAASRS